MGAHDFNLTCENSLMWFPNVGRNGLHVLRSVGPVAVDGVAAASRIQRLRETLSRRPSLPRVALPRSVSLYGLRAVDLSRKSPRSRNVLAVARTEVVSRRISGTHFAEHFGRCQPQSRLANLRRLGASVDCTRPNIVRESLSTIRSRGFSIVEPPELEPLIVDWDGGV